MGITKFTSPAKVNQYQ